MEIIKQELRNGYRYIYYDNGAMVKEIETAEAAEEEELDNIHLTDSELIQAEMLLTQQQIVSKQEAIDETLATLLLAQQK